MCARACILYDDDLDGIMKDRMEPSEVALPLVMEEAAGADEL